MFIPTERLEVSAIVICDCPWVRVVLIPVIEPGRTVVKPDTPVGSAKRSPTVYPEPYVDTAKSAIVPGDVVEVNANPEPNPPKKELLIPSTSFTR